MEMSFWTQGCRGSLRIGQSRSRGPLTATRWLPPAPGSGRPSAPGLAGDWFGVCGRQAWRRAPQRASPAPEASEPRSGSQRALGPGRAGPEQDADVLRSPQPHDALRRCHKPTFLPGLRVCAGARRRAAGRGGGGSGVFKIRPHP